MGNKTSRKDALKRLAQLSLGIGFVIGAVDKVAGEIPSPSKKETGATVSQASALQQHPLTRATYYTSLVYDRCNSYDSGYTSYSTVLQAEQTLFPAELNLASIRAQVFSSSVNIYKAMGGGWVTTAEKLASPAAGGVAAR